MKTLTRHLFTAAIFLYAGMLSAQEIYTKEKVKLVQDEVDEFTKQVKKSTKAYYSGKTGSTVKFWIARYGEEYALGIGTVTNLGCSGASDNYVIILFSDNTTLRLDTDMAKIDCSGGKYSLYSVNESMFKGKTIKKIRLRQTSGVVDADYTCEYSMQELIDALK